MDSESLRKSLYQALKMEPRSFAEVHYRLQQAAKSRDQKRQAGLELLLSLLYADVGSHLLASRHLETAHQWMDALPSSKDLQELAQHIAMRISEPESSLDQALVQMSDLERKFIDCVASTPRDKFEIIRHLYGDEADFLASENRLKNLIHRIQTKFPGLIRFAAGRYAINSPSNSKRPFSS